MVQTGQDVSPMSNEGRNLYVVEHITDSLLALMEQHTLNDISISQICDNAGVGRASFYRNFESKEDVLSKHLDHLLTVWARNNAERISQNLIESIFEHYWENQSLCLLLYKHELSHLTLESIKKLLGPKPEHSNIVAYATAYLSYGLFGWIDEWFKRGMQETPNEMFKLWSQAISNTNSGC